MNSKDIDNIFNGNISWRIKLLAFLVNMKKKYLLRKRGPFQGLKNKEGLREYDVDKNYFDSNTKKKGLSAFGRLRNGAEFLELTIESHIPYCDEIILVDNNSEDTTREICQKMKNKYPGKIKIFQYRPEVYKLGSKEYQSVSEDSVHCMSYYYNRVLSKTSYSHCIKLDDDHIIIPKVFKIIKEKVLQSKNMFFHTPLLNIIKEKGEYYVSSKAPFSGLYGDFGVFSISLMTYFIKDKTMENFICPYESIINSTCFFHLKFLKNDKGGGNYVGDFRKTILGQVDQKSFIKVSDNIKSLFLSLYKKYDNQ